jgi:hypothetical protein
MKYRLLLSGVFILAVVIQVQAQDPVWDQLDIQPCNRDCLVSMMDDYTRALLHHDSSALPLALAVRYTENTAQLDVGEGFLWRGTLEETTFKYYVADPMAGQIAIGTVLNIEGRPALVAIRLRVERGKIMEIEHMVDRNVAPEAMELLQTPRDVLISDVSRADRTPREVMIAAANAYFAALTGENGKIAPFDEECVRHENGYRTVNNDGPGRASPSPVLPTADTPMGRTFIKMSMMTCEEQVNTRIFSGIKKIWPRRILIVDEQKGVVATFPLFIHDGTRRTTETVGLEEMPNSNRMAMMLNMVTMESFVIRKGRILHVEAFPFITFPYGLGDGWTIGSGR